MTWLIVIIVVAVAVFLFSKFTGESTDDSLANAGGAAFGCGSVILQIFLAGLGLWLLIMLFGALFN